MPLPGPAPTQTERANAMRTVDGGRSVAVRTSLEPLLSDVRTRLGADVGLILYQAFSSRPEVCALAGSSRADVQMPLPNEPLRLSHGDTCLKPSVRQDLSLRSSVRGYRLELAQALVIPWRDATGRGWLVAGVIPGGWTGGALDLTTTRRYAEKIRAAHRMAGLRGSERLQRDVAAASKRLAEAAAERDDVSSLIEDIAVAAQVLFDTSAAYVALPETDSAYFSFATFVNIRTSPFRRLRVKFGEGLGGFARQLGETVRSCNYADDRRLRRAPVSQTLGEGILSAMCAPLVADGDVVGTLYVANREMTSFTPTDAALLDELAGYAGLGLKQKQVEERRLRMMRSREHERFAFQLHDSVVRSLMQIGLVAEEGIVIEDVQGTRRRLEIIGRAAEQCLETLREQLLEFTEDRPSYEQMRLPEVVKSLGPEGGDWSVHVDNSGGWNSLPRYKADTLARIAQEAFRNAELHSGSRRRDVHLHLSREEVVLRIVDDGKGMTEKEIARAFDRGGSHFGLRSMRAAAEEVGGYLAIHCGQQAGLIVEAGLPISTDSDVV